MSIMLTVNDEEKEVNVDPTVPLSTLLREELELKGTKRGCETGKCGACTVIVDGKATKSCQRLAGQTEDADVLTIEGLADRAEESEDLHPVQQGFIDEFGMQCGYCTPGIAMMSVALLEENPNPTREEIQHGIKGNLCRCTGYAKIYDAVLNAADQIEDTSLDPDTATSDD
jgi:carbon-monoxide dehydrogenase small subunit